MTLQPPLKLFRKLGITTGSTPNRGPSFKPFVALTNEEEALTKFIDHFTYYFCRVCNNKFGPQSDNQTGFDQFHHAGTLFDSLEWVPPETIFQRFVQTFAWYLTTTPNTDDLEELFSQAFLSEPDTAYSDPTIEALRYIDQNFSSTFVSHGLEEIENVNYVDIENFPPLATRMSISVAEHTDFYAIETDIPPFTTCFSRHHQCFPWHYLSGIMTARDFKELGGTFKKANDREHLYASSKINIRDWVFMYSRKPKVSQSGLHFTNSDMSKSISDLRGCVPRYVEVEILDAFFRLRSLLHQKNEILALMKDQ